MTSNKNDLLQSIEPLRLQLLRHPLYASLRDLDALRIFMEHHVFAVWDFMSLIKSLQSIYCGTTIPWVPCKDAKVARMIHEIILEEETDEDGEGDYASHFELYLRAMKNCGADTQGIDSFVRLVAEGTTVDDALTRIGASDAVGDFVRHTFSVIRTGDPVQIVSAFTYGRENLLPDVFGQIVERIDEKTNGEVSMFRYYLERHIGLDGDVHGPLAEQLVCHLCGNDSARWQLAQRSATQALEHRLRLWDSLHQAISVVVTSPHPNQCVG